MGWPAFVLLLLGTASLQHGLPFVGAVACTAGVLLTFTARHLARKADDTRSGGHFTDFLVAITLLGALLRFWHLAEVPPGIAIDEGRTGLWSLRLLHGESFWGRPEAPEPMISWFQSAAFAAFGPGLTAARAVSALVGTVTVPVMVWALAPTLGTGPAVLGAACLAVNRWHIEMSRLGTNFSLLPLCVLIHVGFLIRAWRSRRAIDWLMAGTALGVALYSYLPARAWPVVTATALVAVALSDPGRRPRLRDSLLLFGTAGLVALPLLWHIAVSPTARWMRMAEICAPFLSDPLGVGLEHLTHALTVYLLHGDDAVISSFPLDASAPALGWLGGALLLAGLPLTYWAEASLWNWLQAFWFVSAIVVCLLTGVSEWRLVGIIPLVCAIQGLALDHLGGGRRRFAVVAAMVAALGFQEARGFLGGPATWQGDPGRMASEFRSADRELAGRLTDFCSTHRVFLSPETADPSGRSRLDLYGSSIVFLVQRDVRPGTVEHLGDLAGDEVCVALALSQSRRELLEEAIPGGHWLVAEGPWRAGQGAGFYVMDRRLRPKVDLAELKFFVDELEELQWPARPLIAPDRLALAEALVRRHPSLAESHIQLGEVQLELGKSAEARVSAERAIALSGHRNSRAYALAGTILADRGDFDGAATAWAWSLRLDPFEEPVWFNLALALSKSGRTAEARTALRSGLARYPTSPDLHRLVELFALSP